MTLDDPRLFGGHPPADGLRLHLEAACKELNVRIARLALALGVPLETEADVRTVVHHPSVPDELKRRVHGRLEAGGVSPRREEQLWSELRGLILLRDEMEKRCVDEVGPAAARGILVEVEAQMERQGFRRGADGLDLARLFDAS